jgi:aryl-alcohol dehydrogenase-like predicted oxidoreductase
MQLNLTNLLTYTETVKQYRLNLNGNRIPYGMGCGWVGQPKENYKETIKAALLAFETAYEFGFRYFDTAPAYANGERVLGEFVPAVPRSDIFLATKVELYQKPETQPVAEFTWKSLAESLKTLKTDYLDLYQVHDIDDTSNVWGEEGVLKVLLEAKRQGLVRYIGMATRPHTIIEETIRHADFDTILTYADYTPLNRTARPLIELAHAQGIGVINASPLSGILIKWKPEEIAGWAGRPEYIRMLQVIADHDAFTARCKQWNISILQAALNFPLTQPAIDINLTGPANAAEVRSSIDALKAGMDSGFWDAWQNR